MFEDANGRASVQKIMCSRVYHINVVLRLRTNALGRAKRSFHKEKAMQLQRARVIMNQNGIQRLEAANEAVTLHATLLRDSRLHMHMAPPHLAMPSILGRKSTNDQQQQA